MKSIYEHQKVANQLKICQVWKNKHNLNHFKMYSFLFYFLIETIHRMDESVHKQARRDSRLKTLNSHDFFNNSQYGEMLESGQYLTYLSKISCTFIDLDCLLKV